MDTFSREDMNIDDKARNVTRKEQNTRQIASVFLLRMKGNTTKAGRGGNSSRTAMAKLFDLDDLDVGRNRWKLRNALLVTRLPQIPIRTFDNCQ